MHTFFNQYNQYVYANMSPPKDPIKYKDYLVKQSISHKGQPSRFKGKHHTREAREKNASSHRGKLASVETRQKMSAARTGKKNHNYGKHQSRETREKNSIAHRGENHPQYGVPRPYNVRMKIVEGHVGGFWYGNVRYSNPPKYCELWCPDLWNRIDEAQNYQSILSGKTKFDNGGRVLSRHHVYYQKKACCEWDEDANGYYAWVDVGTLNISHRVKYYIPGDPNKFVLLTSQEHGMVKKNKLKWIKIFEDLIETKLNGICYLPKIK